MNPLKAALLACFSLFICLGAVAQSGSQIITINKVTVPPVMPGDLSKWSGTGLTLTARTNSPDQNVRSRLIVRIKNGSEILCDNFATASAMAAFGTKEFSAAELLAGLSCQKLATGNYRICFQFFSEGNEVLSAEECRDFRVEQLSKSVVYSVPSNLIPKDNQLFVPEEVTRPIRFQWTAVTPSPEGKVNYLLRIWQIKEGQSMSQAMSANKPLFTRDLTDATSTTLETGLQPCTEPDFTCQYVWNVQARDAAGNPIGPNEGNSQPTAFTAADYIIRIKNIKVSCTATPGVYSFSYQVENPNPGTAKLTTLVVTSSVPSGASITSFTPPLNTNIVSGGNIIITGTISASPTLSFICIGAEITDLVNSFWKASRDTCIPVPSCKCDACDPKKVGIEINPTNNVTINSNNTMSFSQPIAIATTPLKLVKNVEAQLIYFEFLPENEKCPACSSDPKDFGNMYSGVLAAAWAAGTGTHSLDWIFSPAVNFTSTQNASITITIPPTAGCCVRLRWCIRYVFTFNDCTVCSKIVCYEKKKVGCSNGNPDHDNK